jgi:hypothetical protein
MAMGIARVEGHHLGDGVIFGFSGKFSHKFVVVKMQPKTVKSTTKRRQTKTTFR